jgi:carbon monoxide dehydrogenase subunit G
MHTLKSQEFAIEQTIERVLAFLAEPKNYFLLLPENQTSDFQCTTTQFSFKAAGQVHLALEKQVSGTTLLHFKGLQSNPFAFDLFVHLEQRGMQTIGHIEIKADLNIMLKMLIEKPLQKLLVEMAENLSKHLTQNT